jgi:uncharacterized membrane protein
MIIWGILCGALLGLSQDFYGMEVFIGGACGLVAGLGLRAAVRSEIKAANDKLRKQMQEWVKKNYTGLTLPVAAPEAASDRAPVAVDPAIINAPLAAEALVVQAVPADPFDFMAFPEPKSQPLQPTVAATKAATFTSPTSSAPSVTLPSAAAEALGNIEHTFNAARDWLLGGNTIVRVGLVILFIGLSFLASYAASAGIFPIEFRLAGIGAAGIALLAVGFLKRTAKPGFALALQGAGVAVIYLTVFAAFRLFDLIAPLPAFGLMLLVCVLSCALALLQDSRSLAFAAFAGGFAVPLLLSTGEGSSVGLFSYYTVLNLAILFIAYKRSWRVLNMLGFIATFGIATTWGVLKYDPELYLSSQLFLAIFVLIYLAAAIMYARNTPTRLGNTVDSTLMFGTALIGFGLQAGLVRQFELGTAFAAIGFAALYLLSATILLRTGRGNYRLMIESMLVIGIGFLTLAVPLALDASWTSGVWALEGAAAFWVGMRQARWMPRAFGLVMQPVAAFAFLAGLDSNVFAWPFANPLFLGAMLIALPAFLIAWWLRTPLPHSESRWAHMYAPIEARLASPVYLYAFFFWCIAFALEIYRSLPPVDSDAVSVSVISFHTQPILTMLVLVLSAWLSALLGYRKHWAVAIWPSRVTLAVLVAGFLLQMSTDLRVLDTPSWAIWLVTLALHYRMLYQNDMQHSTRHDTPSPEANTAAESRSKSLFSLYRATHVGGAWLITLLLGDCVWFWIGRGDLWATSWATVVLLVSAIIVLLSLAVWAGKANQAATLSSYRWPRNPHAVAYYWYAAAPMAMLVFAGALLVSVLASGHAEPLPYIPFLNPIDLSIALALGGLVFWRRAVASANPAPARAVWVRSQRTLFALAGLAFIAINTVWLRIAHHFFGVDWDSVALFESFVVQTGYAILWTLLALAVMVLAHRRMQRGLWLAGAGLLGLVVIKLLLIDLSNAGGGERIITFIAVGVLMLVVGYFAPLPPKRKSADVAHDPAANPAAPAPILDVQNTAGESQA